MPNPPAFWSDDGPLPRALSPVSFLVAAITAHRMARPGWRAPVPVICCGNVTSGGAGKTTLALDLLARLAARGVAAHALLRGYGGRERGPLRVDPAAHTAARVGDEALLLAAIAPTWVSADRAAGAAAAVAAGAGAIVMDDGLQNPGLAKDVSFLVIDGASGFGNGRVLPAGPLREPVAAGAARCRAAVLIGPDRTGALSALPPCLPVLRADLASEAAVFAGQPVFAFAGIARPPKFFDGLEAAGLMLLGRRAFPDHHPYTPAEIDDVIATAAHLGARPVTTPKDAVRIPADRRAAIGVIGVSISWQDPAALEALLP